MTWECICVWYIECGCVENVYCNVRSAAESTAAVLDDLSAGTDEVTVTSVNGAAAGLTDSAGRSLCHTDSVGRYVEFMFCLQHASTKHHHVTF